MRTGVGASASLGIRRLGSGSFGRGANGAKGNGGGSVSARAIGDMFRLSCVASVRVSRVLLCVRCCCCCLSPSAARGASSAVHSGAAGDSEEEEEEHTTQQEEHRDGEKAIRTERRTTHQPPCATKHARSRLPLRPSRRIRRHTQSSTALWRTNKRTHLRRQLRPVRTAWFLLLLPVLPLLSCLPPLPLSLDPHVRRRSRSRFGSAARRPWARHAAAIH